MHKCDAGYGCYFWRKIMFTNVLIFCAVSLMSVGCGTNYGGNGGGGGNYAGHAQGVYSGTSSNGYTFSTIVIPDDKFYAIYGTGSGNTLLLFGVVTGQGSSGNGTYTASVTDFFYTRATNSGSVNATYVAGSSLNGTLTENAIATTFTGNAEPASSFTYNTAASLSAITGSWTGTLLDGTTTTVTINSNGSVSGSSSGCSFSGTVGPDISNKNFFDVSWRFGASPCSLPNLFVTGVAVEYLLSDGVTHQLLAGATAGTFFGTAFAATR
jgi:hypothetical protein